MCLICQTELCQEVALNRTESRSHRFRKWHYSGVILVSIWTRGGWSRVWLGLNSVFRWCVYASRIDVVILAHAVDYIVLRAP